MTSIGIYIPPGHAGLTGVALFMASVQLYPFSRGNWIKGNNIKINDSINYYVNERETELIIKTYNLDDKLDHTVEVRITIEELSILGLLVDINARLSEMNDLLKEKTYKPGTIAGMFKK